MPHKDPAKRREYARTIQRRLRHKQRERRIEEREAVIANRPKWPDTDLAWAAGVFEGEGTVTITRAGRAGYSRCFVTLTNTDPEIVWFFHERWPGKLSQRRANPKHKVAYVWTVFGNHILGFLEDVRPHLRTQAERAKFDIVLACQRARWRGKRSPEYRTTIEAFRNTIARLNRRGSEPE